MDQVEKFYNKALHFLSYRLRSEKEVKDYLKKKEAESSIIEFIIQRLKAQKFLNDEEFARVWLEQRKKSLRLVRLELRQKGVDKELVEQIVHDSELKIKNDLERAKKLIERRIGRFDNAPKEELYQKLGHFLARRGFDWDTIKKAIDALLQKGYNTK